MGDQEEHKSFKAVLLGESAVGKTSIIARFTEGTFDDSQSSTSGATFSSKVITLTNGKTIMCELWDTAGQERFRSLAKMFYKDAAVCILVYDITRKDSYKELKNYWVQQVKENAKKNIILAIAGNKSDLYEHEEVDEEEARNFAKKINAIYRVTSAKNAEGINELFIAVGDKFVNPSRESEEEEGKDGKGVKIGENNNAESEREKNGRCC